MQEQQSSSSALRAAATGKAPAKAANDFPAMLNAFLPEIKRALPSHLNGDRMARIALTAFRTTPKLAECDPRSVFAAVIQASQLGLEPNIMGQAYLIPYGKNCNLIPGYQGLIDLARRSGKIVSLYAHVVREKDDFDYTLGVDKTLTHKPFDGEDAGPVIGAYAVAKLKEGGCEFEWMSRAQIDKIMRATQSKGESGPWKDHYEEMCRKTVVRRLFKWLPKSVELQSALALDDTGHREQNITIESAIEGTFVPVAEEQGAPTGAPDADGVIKHEGS